MPLCKAKVKKSQVQEIIEELDYKFHYWRTVAWCALGLLVLMTFLYSHSVVESRLRTMVFKDPACRTFFTEDPGAYQAFCLNK